MPTEMRDSVSENFKIQRWIGFCFFQNSESSGGVGDEKAVLGKSRPSLWPFGCPVEWVSKAAVLSGGSLPRIGSHWSA
jgi:hypothetical protein